MSSSKESKDRFEKTFSRKKKDNPATTTSTTSEKKTKTGEKPDSQIQTKSNDKHTNITILGLQYKPPSEKKKKKKNVADGSVKPKQPKLKAEKDEEKKRKGDDEKMKPEKDKVKKKKGEDEKPKPEKDKEKKRKGEDEKTKPEKDKEKKRKGEDGNVGVVKMRKKEKTDKDEEEGLECAFPTARITRIIKSDGFDCKITGEAVFLINKATEKFIELLSEDAYACAVEDRKNFVAYKHLSSVVSKGNLFDFLSDFIPEKVTAEKALAERNPTQNPAQTLPQAS